jgi:hypothetical protein
MAERDEFTTSCFGSFPLPIESSVWFHKADARHGPQRVGLSHSPARDLLSVSDRPPNRHSPTTA